MTSRMFDNSDSCCPSCLLPDERASHLNLCLCPERTRQFKESVTQLQQWLDKRHTHPDIAIWSPVICLVEIEYNFKHSHSTRLRIFACNFLVKCNGWQRNKILLVGRIFSKGKSQNNSTTFNRHTSPDHLAR